MIQDGKNCLIIENKINDAVDQQEQLKRYIDKCKEKGYIDENIHLLYLVSMNAEKYLNAPLSTYAESFKEKTKVASYHPTLIEWLESSVLPNIKHKDNDFYCFNSQYIDYP
ncbi:PD-(D/E)XK nuclease family protein [Proteus vulgaris]|nr:PD-(D/E)XK nuclease family protein [Proteus vulgaris]